jgi:hypothetical protein
LHPFDIKAAPLARHAQHVVLIHFPIALFIAGVAGLAGEETAIHCKCLSRPETGGERGMCRKVEMGRRGVVLSGLLRGGFAGHPKCIL